MRINKMDPTSPLAQNMSKENHDAYFKKFWVCYCFDGEVRSQSFNTLDKARNLVKEVGGKIFYGNPIK
jgi:hypothetical protein